MPIRRWRLPSFVSSSSSLTGSPPKAGGLRSRWASQGPSRLHARGGRRRWTDCPPGGRPKPSLTAHAFPVSRGLHSFPAPPSSGPRSGATRRSALRSCQRTGGWGELVDRRIRRSWLLLAGFLLPAASVPFLSGVASGQAAPTVSISPTSGPIGTQITATVRNCPGGKRRRHRPARLHPRRLHPSELCVLQPR